jgi:hypothetical protein
LDTLDVLMLAGILRGQAIPPHPAADDQPLQKRRTLTNGLDAGVGELLIDALAPLSLETTLAIQSEVEAREAEAGRLRRQHVERARHEAEVAQHRFLRVHPDNRLVADALEAEWNA